jgi:hypothetical protein
MEAVSRATAFIPGMDKVMITTKLFANEFDRLPFFAQLIGSAPTIKAIVRHNKELTVMPPKGLLQNIAPDNLELLVNEADSILNFLKI